MGVPLSPTVAIIGGSSTRSARQVKKPRIRWNDSPARFQATGTRSTFLRENAPLPAGGNKACREEPSLWKGIEFQEFDRDGKLVYRAMISNNSQDPPNQYPLGVLVLSTSQVSNGLLEFDSQETPTQKLGRYLLGDLNDKLKERSRVTFYWREG